jgi:hypothetical protein
VDLLGDQFVQDGKLHVSHPFVLYVVQAHHYAVAAVVAITTSSFAVAAAPAVIIIVIITTTVMVSAAAAATATTVEFAMVAVVVTAIAVPAVAVVVVAAVLYPDNVGCGLACADHSVHNVPGLARGLFISNPLCKRAGHSRTHGKHCKQQHCKGKRPA